MRSRCLLAAVLFVVPAAAGRVPSAQRAQVTKKISTGTGPENMAWVGSRR